MEKILRLRFSVVKLGVLRALGVGYAWQVVLLVLEIMSLDDSGGGKW